MAKNLWLIGLLIACLAGMLVSTVPPKHMMLPLIVLLGGLVLFFIGFFTRIGAENKEKRQAMSDYAQAHGFPVEEEISTDGFPPHLSLFQRGTERRAECAIGITLADRQGALFLYRYYQPGHRTGQWLTRTVLLVRQIPGHGADFQMGPENLLDKVVTLLGGQDIDFTGNETANKFSRLYRLRGAEEEPIRKIFTGGIQKFFSEHPSLSVELRSGDLVIWLEPTATQIYRQGWKRSFQKVSTWMKEEISTLQQAAKHLIQAIQRADSGTGEKAEHAG